MSIDKNILSVLAYFDLFDYPLTKIEIQSFLGEECLMPILEKRINLLIAEQIIFKCGDFISLQKDIRLSIRRKTGNERASYLLCKAKSAGKILSFFPFVKGVAISGSLSKNFADQDSDIDFFIITEKGKLWLARTILHFFKKLTFLFRCEHLFCMNYFIDENNLSIKEKNIYTAIEVVTLIPIYGRDAFSLFFSTNNWYRNYLPNYRIPAYPLHRKHTINIKAILESLLRNPLSAKAEKLLMKITKKRWETKTNNKKLNKKGLVMSMDVSMHYAKPDPGHFQKHLLSRYEDKITQVFTQYNNQVKLV